MPRNTAAPPKRALFPKPSATCPPVFHWKLDVSVKGLNDVGGFDGLLGVGVLRRSAGTNQLSCTRLLMLLFLPQESGFKRQAHAPMMGKATRASEPAEPKTPMR